MKVKRIFIDLDDVLNKCTMFLLKEAGCDIPDMDERWYDPAWGYNIIKAANCLTAVTGVKHSISTFWDSVSRDVWATIPYSDEFATIMNATSKAVGKSNVALLSKPIDDPDCLAGKYMWIKSRCPDWLRNKFFIGCPKKQCAWPGALLIDDSDTEFDEWTTAKAGGQGLLVPRPWNKLHGYDAEEYLKKAFSMVNLGIDMPDDPLAIAYGMTRKEPK